MGQKWKKFLFSTVQCVIYLCSKAIAETPTIPTDLVTLEPVPTQSEIVFNEFAWEASPWSECEMQHSPICCSICLQERRVYCARVSDKLWVPVRYCAGQEQPPLMRNCETCPQDCVVTEWNNWSECAGSCENRKRYRVRQILVPPFSGGKPCNETIEVVSCTTTEKCPLKELARFRWKIGQWTICRRASNLKSKTIGMRFREVICAKKHGKEVKKRHCRRAAKGEEPPASEPCLLPMDCQVSEWSPWNQCSQTCYHGKTGGYGQQTRLRNVLLIPSNSGISCPKLKEVRHCRNESLQRCPRHIWHTSDWSLCSVIETSQSCGPGTQRRSVYCTLEGDLGKKRVPDEDCLDDQGSLLLKPSNQQSCEVFCPQDCQVGEWESWSSCSKSCGLGGKKIRNRPILLPDMYAGKECPALVQAKECVHVRCQWWHTGAWSQCNLRAGYTDCGPGEMVRVVYCQKAGDVVVQNEQCYDQPRPSSSQTCKIPCPDDCVVSNWGEWSQCSLTCGERGGMQTRHRSILAYGKNGVPCLAEDMLSEVQPCNQLSCSTYTWQVSAWGECQRNITSSSILIFRYLGILTDNSGVQKREVFCKTDTGYPSTESLCDQDSKPVNEQVCTVPYSQDCELSSWSRWSECSESCGFTGVQVRMRLILIHAANGGYPCPGSANENGEVHEKRVCLEPSPCPNYKWKISQPWSECHVPKTGCGRGFRTRTVICKNGKHRADPASCLEHDGEPPSKEEKCFKPCAGECVLSPWSDFGPCSRSCGSSPGYRVRIRKLVNLGSASNRTLTCPHITRSDLEQRIICGEGECPSFSWELGEWGSCEMNHNDASCGNGTQVRPIYCKKNGDQYAPRTRCLDTAYEPIKYQRCEIPCPEDCNVSGWSSWSECTAECGEGLKTRRRDMLLRPKNGGRPCPHLEETTVCTTRSCKDLFWVTSDWGRCIVKYDMPCGEGFQRRDVVCPAGIDYEPECEARFPKPPSRQACEVPCVGNCVMSPWSVFGPCDCSADNSTEGIHVRSRQITREPAPEGFKCGQTNQTKPCRCPTYRLIVGSWTSCRPYNRSKCGTGIQQRPVKCYRDDGVPVPTSYCPPVDFSVTSRCQIPCPNDCQVGHFGVWTPCEQCKKNYQTRSRQIIVYPNRFGRRCPRKDQLQQNHTCGFEPCDLHTHSWYRGPWSDCSVEGGGCGYGERHRVVECRRSDGVVVKNINCLLNDMEDGPTFDLKALDLETSQSCGSPCPMDCQATSWSEFGACYRNCSSFSAQGARVRSRDIIKPAEKGGQQCPKKLVDIRDCDTKEMMCPSFQWIVNDWLEGDSRGVFCVSQGGTRVNGGCHGSRMPPARWECPLPCDAYAECNSITGKCRCKTGFEGDGEMCFPVQGCEIHEHCPVNQSYCDTTRAECMCKNGKLPYRGLTCNYTWSTQETSLAEQEEDIEDLVWICLGVSLVLALMLILLASIYFWKRRKNRRGELAISRMVANNLEIPKKATNEYVPIQSINRKNTDPETHILESPRICYMEPSYKIRPRPGVSSSNFYLPVNTDDLDDEVFTDNPSEIFMDPRQTLEDEVFLDSVGSRKSSLAHARVGSDSSRAKSSVSFHPRISSDSSKGADLYSSLRKAKKVAPPTPPTIVSDSSSGDPPACVVGRKRFVLCSSDQDDLDASEISGHSKTMPKPSPRLSDSGSRGDPFELTNLCESYLQFVKSKTPSGASLSDSYSAQPSTSKVSKPKDPIYVPVSRRAPPPSPTDDNDCCIVSSHFKTPDNSMYIINDTSTG